MDLLPRTTTGVKYMYPWETIEYALKCDPTVPSNITDERKNALYFFFKCCVGSCYRGVLNGGMEDGEGTYLYINDKRKWICAMAFAALVMDKFSDLESIVHNVKRDKQRKKEKKRAATNCDSVAESQSSSSSSAQIGDSGDDVEEDTALVDEEETKKLTRQKRCKIWTEKNNHEFAKRYDELVKYFKEIAESKEEREHVYQWEIKTGICKKKQKTDAQQRPDIGFGSRAASRMPPTIVPTSTNMCSLLEMSESEDEFMAAAI